MRISQHLSPPNRLAGISVPGPACRPAGGFALPNQCGEVLLVCWVVLVAHGHGNKVDVALSCCSPSPVGNVQ